MEEIRGRRLKDGELEAYEESELYEALKSFLKNLKPFEIKPEGIITIGEEEYYLMPNCRNLAGEDEKWDILDSIPTLDEVEIYSNYGKGFYWIGSGNEEAKVITQKCMPFEECPELIKKGKPDWVRKELEFLGNK